MDNSTKVPTVNISNKILHNLIMAKTPFLITRIGFAVGIVTYCLEQNIRPRASHLSNLQTHDGIYYNSLNEVKIFTTEYSKAIKNSTYLAAFPTIYTQVQNFLIKQYSKNVLHNRVLEPFYSILEKEKPWTHKLLGKRVLIVNPFITSIKKNIDANFQMFNHEKLFLDGQDFVFYKSFNCLANNRPHKNWIETFEIMCNDIKEIEFDIALLGCGGYGLPLANFIYEKMNKSAIYIGGGLQLLFGIMGQRWGNNDMWKKIMNESQSQFIRPSGDEIIKNKNMIENACYW
jgi:hypothetical protein